MTDFATASIIRRRQILEDVLAEALEPIGSIGYLLGERCLWYVVPHPYRSEPEPRTINLWDLAALIEARLA